MVSSTTYHSFIKPQKCLLFRYITPVFATFGVDRIRKDCCRSFDPCCMTLNSGESISNDARRGVDCQQKKRVDDDHFQINNSISGNYPTVSPSKPLQQKLTSILRALLSSSESITELARSCWLVGCLVCYIPCGILRVARTYVRTYVGNCFESFIIKFNPLNYLP